MWEGEYKEGFVNPTELGVRDSPVLDTRGGD